MRLIFTKSLSSDIYESYFHIIIYIIIYFTPYNKFYLLNLVIFNIFFGFSRNSNDIIYKQWQLRFLKRYSSCFCFFSCHID